MYELDKYTVSLLHFDEDFTDETGNVWTAQNGASVSTDKFKFGKSALYLNGQNQYLTISNTADIDFENEDFTVDWWEYRTDLKVSSSILDKTIKPGLTYAFSFGYLSPGGEVVCYATSTGEVHDVLKDFSLGKAILNSWIHRAIVRKGDTFYGFENGKLISTVTNKLSIFTPTLETIVGRHNYDGQRYYSGYIDEFRISKGIARWTENFNPEPIKTNNLLRITMSDSSEREYKVSTAEKDNFIKWFNSSDVVVETSSYEFDKDINGSKEYVAYDKIISFETVTNNSQNLLRITMSDSSEREYKVTADMFDTFVKWFNRSNASVRNTSYLFNKDIDGGKEYLSFDKIISFEVIDLL
ncbi:MAG: glucanase superfamily [Firmicutes bacterium]|nr:glucanase superfamily [Bacillota bacterium]